jgi:hypothetical protein
MERLTLRFQKDSRINVRMVAIAVTQVFSQVNAPSGLLVSPAATFSAWV